MELDCFYGRQAEQFTFYRVPKAILFDKRFDGVSADAMLLPFDNTVIALICSEVQDDLPLNRSINEQFVLRGKAFICGWDGQRLRELTRKQAERYSRRYLYPEQLVDAGDALMAVPQTPRVKPIDERLGRKSWLRER